MKIILRKPQWLLSGLAGILLGCAGCIGPHYHPHQIVFFGIHAPKINGAHDPAIETNLTTVPWHKSLVGPEAGVGVVLLKSMGLQGWNDFHIHAKAEGPVVMHQIASSGFFTVDIRLNSLTLDDVSIPLTGTNYMRLEVFLGRVGVDKAMRHETNEVVAAEGKLAWDTDGWFEIHPQKTGDVRVLSGPPTDSIRTNSPASP